MRNFFIILASQLQYRSGAWLYRNQPPLFNRDDDVAVLQRANPVGDDECRPALSEPFHCFQQRSLSLHIDRTSRLVEDENRRVLQECSSNGNALALTAGKTHAAFTNKSVVTIRQADNKLVRIGGPGRSYDFILASAGTAICDVLGDAGRKQDRFLKDDTELVAEIGQFVVAQLQSIEQNLSFHRVVKTRQEIHQRGLAGTRGADDAHAFAWPDLERDILQDRLTLTFVTERNMAEGHPANRAL